MSGHWPEPAEYAEAVQTPQLSFCDSDLQAATPEMGAIGPFVYSGNFASVFHLVAAEGRRGWAVKCFTRQVPGLRDRYRLISEHLSRAQLSCTVAFEYLEKGILIRNEWFPVLKMDWVTGETLEKFVERNLDRPSLLRQLSDVWLKVEPMLRRSQVAHGDLQHGNILLVPKSTEGRLSLRLIDYDGLWTPDLAERQPGESGHPAYQHPRRLSENLYTPEIDRFPHLVIAATLRCLTSPLGPLLWEKYHRGDNLLFTRADFEAPHDSQLLQTLWNTENQQLRAWANLIAVAASSPLSDTAPLAYRLDPKGRPLPTWDEATRGAEMLWQPSAAAADEMNHESNWIENWEDPLSTLWYAPPSGAISDLEETGWSIDTIVLTFVAFLVGATLLIGFRVFSHESAEETRPKPAEFTNSIGMKLVRISAGEFLQGSSDSDTDARNREKPRRRVRITKDFYLGMNEVTQGEWIVVMGTKPWQGHTSSLKEGRDYPATYVSWYDAQEFVQKLSQKDGRTYRLPTEAEWEYAARGGTSTRYSFGDDHAELHNYAWCDLSLDYRGGQYAHQVRSKRSNPFGLFDMHGNVWEWCSDWYDENEYAKYGGKTVLDPQGRQDGVQRVMRGGSWNRDGSHCRSAERGGATPRTWSSHLGFRVVADSPVE